MPTIKVEWSTENNGFVVNKAMNKPMQWMTKIAAPTQLLSRGAVPSGALWLGAIALVISAGGCQDLQVQALAPTPAPVPTPAPDVFDPTQGVKQMASLNAPNDPKLPDKFRVVRVDTGELLALQTVKKVTVGTPPVERDVTGTVNVMRLGGIITPLPGQPGFAETLNQVQKWTLGQDVDVEQEPRFGQDFNANSRRIVQVYYKQRGGEFDGQRMLLNRMLVRLGYAVVDLNAPVSFPLKDWLNDEAFAREKKLGLWGLGITLAQRVPVSGPLAQAAQNLVPKEMTSSTAGAAPAGGGEGGGMPGGPGGMSGPGGERGAGSSSGAPMASTAPSGSSSSGSSSSGSPSASSAPGGG